jgi:hypothetical protein
MKVKKDQPKNDIIVIAGEDNKPIYQCSYCNRTLVKLSDSKGDSPSFYCKSCNIEVLGSDADGLRRKSKLNVPKSRNTGVLVSTTPGIDYENIKIQKGVEVKGGLAELKKRGLKITDYNEKVG